MPSYRDNIKKNISPLKQVPITNLNKPVNKDAISRKEKLEVDYRAALRRILNDGRSSKFDSLDKIDSRIDTTINRYVSSAYFNGVYSMTGKYKIKKLGDRHSVIPVVPKEDQEHIKRLADKETGYFKAFVRQYAMFPDNVKIGDKTPKDAIPGSMSYDRRLSMYGGSLQGAHNFGVVHGVLSDFDDDVEIWWDLSPFCIHCASCIVLSACSPYKKGTLHTVPGAGETLCGSHCRCSLRFITNKISTSPKERDDSPYIYKGKVDPISKLTIDDAGFRINYYRQMADLAETQEERDMYLKLRSEANKEVVILRKTAKVNIAPKLEVERELVPAAKSLGNLYQVVPHEAKSNIQTGQLLGVLKGTDYSYGQVLSNDGKSIQMLFSNKRKPVEIPYDHAVLYNKANELGAEETKRILKQIQMVEQQKGNLVEIERVLRNAIPTVRDEKVLALFESVSLASPEEREIMKSFTGQQISLQRLLIEYVSSRVLAKTLQKAALDTGITPMVTNVGVSTIRNVGRAYLPNIDGVGSSSLLINFERALSRVPIYQNDVVWRNGVASFADLQTLERISVVGREYRNIPIVSGVPVRLDSPLDMDYQAVFKINSLTGRAIRPVIHNSNDIYFKRGSSFVLRDKAWDNHNTMLKLYFEEKPAYEYVMPTNLKDVLGE